jgi:hypothetical protein
MEDALFIGLVLGFKTLPGGHGDNFDVDPFNEKKLLHLDR